MKINYSEYYLSGSSVHIPEVVECFRCPFINRCGSGRLCIVKKTERTQAKTEKFFDYKTKNH